MRYSAIKPRIVLGHEPPKKPERPPSRLQETGDKFCCAGFIIAGLLGYGLAYWFMTTMGR